MINDLAHSDMGDDSFGFVTRLAPETVDIASISRTNSISLKRLLCFGCSMGIAGHGVLGNDALHSATVSLK